MAYGSRANRAYLRRRGIGRTIPENADQVRNRKKLGSRGGRPPRGGVRHQPAEKAPGRGATRYDKPAVRYEATVQVAAIIEWL
ncbi:hypothetical protein ACIHCQ_27315 [Streptomyces sp. NPDC052236]|uniref:hypothetical protein n=1 Tax=Streptomyces sp. NPDC052236 TaxID=3365686 RepID=UPI0037CEFBA5